MSVLGESFAFGKCGWKVTERQAGPARLREDEMSRGMYLSACEMQGYKPSQQHIFAAVHHLLHSIHQRSPWEQMLPWALMHSDSRLLR